MPDIEPGYGPEPQAPACRKCGRAPPEGAIYCPYCCDQGDPTTTSIRRTLKGALVGFLIAVIPSILLLAIYGPVRGVKGLVFVLLVTGAATGFTLAAGKLR